MKKLLQFLSILCMCSSYSSLVISCGEVPKNNYWPSFAKVNLAFLNNRMDYYPTDTTQMFVNKLLAPENKKLIVQAFEAVQPKVNFQFLLQGLSGQDYHKYFTINLDADLDGKPVYDLNIDNKTKISIFNSTKVFVTISVQNTFLYKYFAPNPQRLIIDLNDDSINQKTKIITEHNKWNRIGYGYDDQDKYWFDKKNYFYYTFWDSGRFTWDDKNIDYSFIIDNNKQEPILVTGGTYESQFHFDNANGDGLYFGYSSPGINLHTFLSATIAINNSETKTSGFGGGVWAVPAMMFGLFKKIDNYYYSFDTPMRNFIDRDSGYGMSNQMISFKTNHYFHSLLISDAKAWTPFKNPTTHQVTDDWLIDYAGQDKHGDNNIDDMTWTEGVANATRLLGYTDNNPKDLVWSNPITINNKLFVYVKTPTHYDDNYHLIEPYYLAEFDPTAPRDSDGRLHIIKHVLNKNVQLDNLYAYNGQVFGISYADNSIYKINPNTWTIKKLAFPNYPIANPYTPDQQFLLRTVTVYNNTLYVWCVNKNSIMKKINTDAFWSVPLNNVSWV